MTDVAGKANILLAFPQQLQSDPIHLNTTKDKGLGPRSTVYSTNPKHYFKIKVIVQAEVKLGTNGKNGNYSDT